MTQKDFSQKDLSKPKAVQRLGFIHMGGLGDYMMFSPIIKLFRHVYPHAHITLITLPNFGPLRELFPEIDSVVMLGKKDLSFLPMLRHLRQSRFDALVVNYEFALPNAAFSLALACSGIPLRVGSARDRLRQSALTVAVENMARKQPKQYLGKTFALLADAYFKRINKPISYRLMDLYQPQHASVLDTPQALAEIPQLENVQASPKIVIHPGASRASKEEGWDKTWPAQSWGKLIQQLLLRHPEAIIYLTGGPDDAAEIQAIVETLAVLPPEAHTRVINLYGQIPSVTCLAGLFRLCDVFIGCDSFAMHLALYTGTPLVAIFALTNEHRFLPLHDPARQAQCLVASRQDLDCRPCLHIHRSHSCDTPLCQDVPVSTVLAKVEQHLAQIQIPVIQKAG